MATAPSRRGDRQPSERRDVGLTLPRQVKEQLLAAAAAHDCSAAAWVLAASAEHGPALRDTLRVLEVRRRPRVGAAAFTVLQLTAAERDHLDDLAVACGLNRSAFVTSVARLALGEELEVVLAPLVEPG